MPKTTKHKKVTVTRSSGNVFADLALANASAELAKGKLLVALAGAIQAKGLKQTEAARLLGLTQPKISKLLRGDNAGTDVISVDAHKISRGSPDNARFAVKIP